MMPHDLGDGEVWVTNDEAMWIIEETLGITPEEALEVLNRFKKENPDALKGSWHG